MKKGLKLDEKLPDFLMEYAALIQRAFPEPLEDSEYFAVLYLLCNHFSIRCLADIATVVGKRDWAEAYNDVLGSFDGRFVDETVCKRVQTRLEGVGLIEQLKIDDESLETP